MNQATVVAWQTETVNQLTRWSASWTRAGWWDAPGPLTTATPTPPEGPRAAPEGTASGRAEPGRAGRGAGAVRRRDLRGPEREPGLGSWRLDEGRYWCSTRTMYRILAAAQMTGERRRQAVHPPRVIPELVATAPGQVWSWDITKMRGPARDLVPRLRRARHLLPLPAGLAHRARRGRPAGHRPGRGTSSPSRGRPPGYLHADGGPAMTSKPLASFLVDLDIRRTHNRPRTSNDNPYSESQFKTMKYMPDYPDRFATIGEARAWMAAFATWYNHEHRHSGIGLHTPANVHYGHAEKIQHERQQTRCRVRCPSRSVPPTPPRAQAARARHHQRPAKRGERITVQKLGWTRLIDLTTTGGAICWRDRPNRCRALCHGLRGGRCTRTGWRQHPGRLPRRVGCGRGDRRIGGWLQRRRRSLPGGCRPTGALGALQNHMNHLDYWRPVANRGADVPRPCSCSGWSGKIGRRPLPEYEAQRRRVGSQVRRGTSALRTIEIYPCRQCIKVCGAVISLRMGQCCQRRQRRRHLNGARLVGGTAADR